jgi:hypothetical protein
LKPEKPKWKSDIPLTETQLRSKREEFWDTAPAFEGRKEIWDALKAAAYALETGDHVLAQAIVDGANISLSHGNLFNFIIRVHRGPANFVITWHCQSMVISIYFSTMLCLASR